MNATVVPQADSLRHHGILKLGRKKIPCAIGKAGMSSKKKEGDQATPVGGFLIRRVFYRADRLAQPRTDLPISPLRPNHGWCDDPDSPAYNRLVSLPCPWNHEEMWREDHLYDLVGVLSHNDAPPIPGNGSAIFIHVAEPDLGPTEGCVAMPINVLCSLLESWTVGQRLIICDKA